MRRLFLVVLTLLLIISLCACKQYRTDITQEDIITAYEAAGYTVSSKLYDKTLEHGQIGYVQADHLDGNYIYFAIFETEDEANAYKNEFYHPGMLSLFSAIFGEPSWPRWEVYGCIVVQYDDSQLYIPFKNLIS